ncbi:probable serine/threonine-protein kinase PBL19 [Elaeis guineensis]|uniref:non-specific serine/threonine protein kinase n=1 Tax=Elaeis guineensis var. tenera TaxID=51953 RepID=A0A6I9R3E5_ELAGV|nr:probable serine/threonine-protein kinase PBL19 [Elaeis guineensis]XP_010919812.1 probable serine/threonine-protein kinase PBL19 [Elaeis guineensis]
MRCFFYFKDKFKGRKQPKSSPTTGLVLVSSPTSNNDGSRSEGSGAAKQQSKSSGSVSSQRSIPELYEERAHNLRVFELKELRNATNDFSRLLKIGEGGFGSVYKGWIKPLDGKGDNIVVAVKKLNPNSLQGHKQWLAEVQFLGVVEHPNLVKLIGYCAVDGERGAQRLLVYEFVPNRSLEDHLFNKAYPSLPWNIRLQIALGAAEGLVYLHEGLEVQVIYRDFKASNVLLDEEFKPKLSDFGLAREGPTGGNTHVSTAVMGTYGYAAPDYVETGHLTAKSDVWSFGVVLYEILTGRRSMERNRPRNEQKLLDWVKQFPVEGRRFSMIMDPRLENKYSLRASREIAKLANSCLSKHARERPKMIEVLESLKQAMQHKELDGCVESIEGNSPTNSDNEEKTEQEAGLKSSTRRMLHLAKLRESANAIGRRRFMLMKAANPT